MLGVVLRSRDPVRPLVAGLAFLLLHAAFYRRDFAHDIARLFAVVSRAAPALAVILGVALAVHGLSFGSFGVGGADAYGYVNQAYDWTSRTLPHPIPLTASLSLPESDQLQIPLGYRIGPEPHTMVPTYAPGLPLLMAAALVFGRCGPFFVVPVFAALFVWWTYRLGERTAGRLTGVVAAVILVASPVVLYQALWPMSDVPAGALWTGAVLQSLGRDRRHAGAAGLLTAAGLFVRPNLLPLALVPAIFVAFSIAGRERWLRLALFGLPIAPVVVVIGTLNSLWFGSPMNSGYGAARELYLWENVGPNLRLYGAWLWQSQSAWVLTALLPIVPILARRMDRRALAACAAMCAVAFACYVSYSQFEVWWYLRFLLPAGGALAVLMAAGLAGITRALPQPFGAIAAGVALWLMTVTTVFFAAEQGVFGRMKAGERRYIDIGEFVEQSLPPNAAIFSMQHSGSLRFYSGRLTLRYDWVKKEWARDVVPALERAGYHPYLVIDDWEADQVRAPFGLAPGALPWAIAARMRELGGITVYDMASTPSGGGPVALEPGTSRWCDARHRIPPRR